MVRFALSIVLLIGAAPAATNQEVTLPPGPTITLVLPSGIASETVQINYFMTGAFGGYGDFVTAEKGHAGYDIAASVGGKPATNVKVIAFLPGCDLVTMDIPVRSEQSSRRLICEPLQQIVLHGQIAMSPAIQPSQIEVTYLADWDHKFFGFSDGPVTTIRIATAHPDQQGRFEVSLPDFHLQPGSGDGEFHFTLRQPGSGNILAFLKPTEGRIEPFGLKAQASYPPIVHFSEMSMR